MRRSSAALSKTSARSGRAVSRSRHAGTDSRRYTVRSAGRANPLISATHSREDGPLPPAPSPKAGGGGGEKTLVPPLPSGEPERPARGVGGGVRPLSPEGTTFPLSPGERVG